AMSERVARSLWIRRAYSWLFAAFSGIATLLAAAGIYSVISFAVSRAHARDRHPHGSRRAPWTGVARRLGRRDDPGRDRGGRGARSIADCYALARDHAVRGRQTRSRDLRSYGSGRGRGGIAGKLYAGAAGVESGSDAGAADGVVVRWHSSESHHEQIQNTCDRDHSCRRRAGAVRPFRHGRYGRKLDE